MNTTAGATGFRRVRFFWLTVIAGCSWPLYSVGIGVPAGHWVQGNAILGVGLAIGSALTIGLIVDQINRLVTARRSAKTMAPTKCTEPARL